MARAIRRHRGTRRSGDRIAFHTGLQVTTEDGKPVAPLARCTNIGLGGLRASAAEGVTPGTIVRVAMRLPSGRVFESLGRVAWSQMTLHPTLLGSPRGRDDDAKFGIAFAEVSTQALLPIARLLVARDHERRNARRIRRLHGLPIHA
ncbi:MAG: hypothetical protein CL908_26375 [Deltaproteobacteria bacterium]|jgi:hypothetical protein|nr:hypothetical protein [Deltaproteobacteria bacterium]